MAKFPEMQKISKIVNFLKIAKIADFSKISVFQNFLKIVKFPEIQKIAGIAKIAYNCQIQIQNTGNFTNFYKIAQI